MQESATMPVHRSTVDGAARPSDRNKSEQDLEQVAKALRGLKFGVVTVIVQDGVVIQIERTERIRLRSK